MKQFLLVVFLLFCFLGNVFGQWGLQTSLVIPSGLNSYILKPGPLFELSLKAPGEDALYEFGGAFGYSSLKPTVDTFKTYAIGGPQGQFMPTYEAVQSYNIFYYGITNDINVMKDRKFSPVVGFDVSFYWVDIVENGSSDDYWLLVVCPRIAARYRISDEWMITAGCGRSISLTGTANPLSFWKPFISISYSND